MASEKHQFRKSDNHWFRGTQKHSKDTVTSIEYKDGKILLKDLGFETTVEGVDELLVVIKPLDSVNKAVTFKAISLAGPEKKIPGRLHGVQGDNLILEWDEEYVPEKKGGGERKPKKGERKASGGPRRPMDLD